MRGDAGQGIPISLTALNDSTNFALTVKNADAANSRAFQVLRSNNNVLFQADVNGVTVSPDGGAAGAQVVNISLAQTLSNKTFTTPIVNGAITGTWASQLTNAISVDVALNNVANFFDGPSIAQGASGLWWVSGSVTVTDTAGNAVFTAKLWDGTTVVASGAVNIAGANQEACISLSGYLSAPAGNLRISVKDSTSVSGVIKANVSGGAKDGVISAFRIG